MQSLGVVLGANIGTAVGAQVIALNIKHYTPLLMFAGMVLSLAFKNETVRNVGIILLGFGLMFFGLDAIEGAVRPLRKYQPFIELMESLGNRPLFGALIGALVTVVIQSSSATVAIVITLASSGMISLPAGVAIVLGAEIGTCSDTLLATIGRGRSALRTGVFHLLFNLATAGLGILFAPQLVQLVLAVSGEAGGRAPDCQRPDLLQHHRSLRRGAVPACHRPWVAPAHSRSRARCRARGQRHSSLRMIRTPSSARQAPDSRTTSCP